MPLQGMPVYCYTPFFGRNHFHIYIYICVYICSPSTTSRVLMIQTPFAKQSRFFEVQPHCSPPLNWLNHVKPLFFHICDKNGRCFTSLPPLLFEVITTDLAIQTPQGYLYGGYLYGQSLGSSWGYNPQGMINGWLIDVGKPAINLPFFYADGNIHNTHIHP